MKGANFGDERLNRRFGKMLTALGERGGRPLPIAFQDWANTTAAYRVFANDKVSDDKIMAGSAPSRQMIDVPHRGELSYGMKQRDAWENRQLKISQKPPG